MNYEGYSVIVTGTLAGVIVGGAFIMGGDVIGGIFAALCAFVIGAAAFSKACDAIETYKAIQRWERHRAKKVDFVVGKPVDGMPGYVEV